MRQRFEKDKEQEEYNPFEVFHQAQEHIYKGIPLVSYPGAENTLIMGNTRGGKSTLVNYLLSNPLKAEILDSNDKGKAGKQLKVVKNGNEAGPTIGTSGSSQTTIPQKWQAFNAVYNKSIWDCPGFGDNRGAAIDISNAFLVSKLLNKAQNVKIVLVCDYIDIESDNPQNFISLMKQVNYLFGDPEIVKHSTILVVTKVDDGNTVEDIVADLRKIIVEIKDPLFDKRLLQHLCEN